jgi:2-amino-4-hydroxy-6-hydroxymethyldihydropteridine diphosphokinase
VTTAYIGLGSNVGDRLENLREAVRLLDAIDEVDVLRTSSVYETKPVGPRQPDFLNAVAEIDTTLAARTLLGHMKRIELDLGRKPTERWGPREIDLDLLLFGDETIDEPALHVPHPELENRAFVLVPLAELAPERYGELAAQVDGRGVRPVEGLLR